MAKLLTAFIAAVALSFALGTFSSITHACDDKAAAAQAQDATPVIQVAQDDSEDQSDDSPDDEDSSDDGESK